MRCTLLGRRTYIFKNENAIHDSSVLPILLVVLTSVDDTEEEFFLLYSIIIVNLNKRKL